MTTLTLRSIKGAPLSIEEVDQNFTNLSTDIGTRLPSASYTAADVLSKVKSVDGTGSGLDADLLRGYIPVSTNTISSLVLRDTGGNFSANTITANLVGNVQGNVIGDVAGDVEGDLTGNVLGNVTGNLGGNVTGNVNGSIGAISPNTGSFTSITLSSTLTTNSSVGTAGQYLKSRGAGLSPAWETFGPTTAVFSTGMIMMWSGSIATIPSGWYLCNGANGTPDLRNKFIVCASNDESGTAKTNVEGTLTQIGGTKDATLVSHTHAVTTSVTDPGHKHIFGSDDQVGTYGGYTRIGSFNYDATSRDSGGGGHFSTKDTNITENPQPTGISISTVIAANGESGTNKNLPPYYALAFIMKG
jgi:hypothetical protein